MNGDDVVPFLLGHVENHAVAQDSGAGDHYVQPAEVVDGGLDDFLATLHGGDRLHARHGLAASRPDFLGHLGSYRVVLAGAIHVDAGVNDDHFCAFCGHFLGNTAPDAAARAGDDCHLVH